VDDGSEDRTFDLLKQWAHEDKRVKVIRFSRNFGHQSASTAGYYYCTGDICVVIDADLQDPLEVIHEMIAQYNSGFDIVYGQRESREGETFVKLITARLYYRFIRYFIHPTLPIDVGDFRLMSRQTVTVLNSLPEKHRFVRGLVAWMGFKQTTVSYARKARSAGATKYSFSKMLLLALDGACSFGIVPLRVSFLGGLLFGCLSVAYGIYCLFRAHFYRDTVPGWATEVSFTGIVGASVLVSNGLLGEYIGRCYEELKGRPRFIIAESINTELANESN
jgi:dolichol-phosphate mannosyltransferase